MSNKNKIQSKLMEHLNPDADLWHGLRNLAIMPNFDNMPKSMSKLRGLSVEFLIALKNAHTDVINMTNGIAPADEADTEIVGYACLQVAENVICIETVGKEGVKPIHETIPEYFDQVLDAQPAMNKYNFIYKDEQGFYQGFHHKDGQVLGFYKINERDIKAAIAKVLTVPPPPVDI